jgi:hypothetical protein
MICAVYEDEIQNQEMRVVARDRLQAENICKNQRRFTSHERCLYLQNTCDSANMTLDSRKNSEIQSSKVDLEWLICAAKWARRARGRDFACWLNIHLHCLQVLKEKGKWARFFPRIIEQIDATLQ